MGIEADIDSPLAEAVRSVGSQSAFARLVGCTQGYVHELLRDGKPLPTGPVVGPGELNWVLKVEAATGIPKERLRPDIYPPAASSPADGSPAAGIDPLTGLEPAQ